MCKLSMILDRLNSITNNTSISIYLMKNILLRQKKHYLF